MTITSDSIARASAGAAVAAGAIFIAVQIGHPHLDAESIRTTEMAVRGSAKVLMAVLALVGITGMYATQVRRNGVLGLLGYVVFAAGYIMVMATTFLAAYALPTLAAANHAYVQGVLDAATGGHAGADIGALEVIIQAQGAAYLAGGLLFGIALFRAAVLSRWAAALLAVSGLVSAALAVMPDAFYRFLAFPNGIAFIALGYSLWKTTRVAATHSGPASADEGSTTTTAAQRPAEPARS